MAQGSLSNDKHVWWPFCQKWNLLINNFLQASSSSGGDQSFIFHIASDTIIFWINLFDFLCQRKCLLGFLQSTATTQTMFKYVWITAQLPGLKYFSRKNSGSGHGNSDTRVLGAGTACRFVVLGTSEFFS